MDHKHRHGNLLLQKLAKLQDDLTTLTAQRTAQEARIREISTEQDRIRRDDTGAEYEVLYVKDAAGQGHHLEVACRLVKSEAVGS